MIKLDNISIMNFKNALRGMRNPMNSWDKSDSNWCYYINDVDCGNCPVVDNCSKNYFENDGGYIIREKDMELAKKLIKAGSDERKFLRQIFISIDITAPIFWWKEMDTYKVATVSNSTSTMHKLTSKEITVDDFSVEGCDGVCEAFIPIIIQQCETLRSKYIETKDKKYWRALIEILPESYNQTRTWTANYEVLKNIYHARKNHKLDEWREFCRWIETLPYAKEFIIE